jgi:hypothetical protein
LLEHLCNTGHRGYNESVIPIIGERKRKADNAERIEEIVGIVI